MKNLPSRHFKPAILSAGKFAIAFVALITCMSLSPIGLNAQTNGDNDASSPYNSNGTSIYNEDYFKQITYQWTDENGVVRVSNLAEPASGYNQIVAFLREVYLNPDVPGFLKDYTWDGSLADATYPNNYVEVPYNPCLAEGNPYGMTEQTVVTRPKEGSTALMVELVDDYTFHAGDDCKALIDKIKRITLLTQQRYVDETVSKGNPGTLFNHVGALNNFFLVTKGNNRIAKDETKQQGFPPFYNMFEEYSPSNKLPIYNAFEEMNAGHGFSVDHNCTSIMGQNHIIVMSPEPEKGQPINEEVWHDYGVNFMFFLPDKRFARDTRKHPDQSVTDYNGEWYTFYSDEHRPYFFFNKIKAEIGSPEIVTVKDENDKDVQKAKIEVSWTSTYNDIVNYEANEDFYVYRVVNDVIEAEPINIKDLVAQNLCGMITPTDDKYTLNDDGSITSQSSSIKLYFYEPYNRFAHNVSYIISGRRYLTDFELTESNIVSNTIPGFVYPPGALNLVIKGDRVSEHKIAEQRNYYKHTIRMFDSAYEGDNVTLAKKHLHATSEPGIEKGTTLNLMRYTGDDKEHATCVATLEITNVTDDTQWKQWLFDYVIKDANGKTYTELGYPAPVENKYIFKTPYKDVADPENALVLAPMNANKVLATFYDNFSVDTSEGTHPDMYNYFIDYVPAVLENGNKIDYDAESNVVDFVIPHNDLKAGYIPYTKEQIDAELEYDTRLPENNPGMQFSATTNPNVESYTIYRMADASTPVRVVKATRMPSGRLSIERASGPDSKLDYCASSYKQMNPIVEVPAAAALTDNEYVLVVKYNNGNTYGNRVANLYDLPRPVIDRLTLSATTPTPNGNDSEYVSKLTWHTEGFQADVAAVNAMESADDYQNFGYRVWRKRHGSDMEDANKHSVLHQEFASYADQSEPQEMPRKVATHQVTENANGSLTHKENFQAHVASEDNPVKYHALVRLYTQLPQGVGLSDGTAPGYVVADADAEKQLTSYKVVTSIDDVIADDTDVDAPVEYYNLQGQRIYNPRSGNVVIRRQGSKVTKVLIP